MKLAPIAKLCGKSPACVDDSGTEGCLPDSPNTRQAPDSDCSSPIHDSWLAPALTGAAIAYLASNLLTSLIYDLSRSHDIPDIMSYSIAVMTMPLLVIAAVMASYVLFACGEPFLKAFRLEKWRWSYIPMAVALETAFFIPMALVALASVKATEYVRDNVAPEWAHYLDTSQQFREYLLNMDWNLFMVVAAVSVIVAPVVEEIVFRRILFSFMSPKIGVPAAFAAASVIFAAIHFRVADFPTLLALGCIWQALYIYHSSLYLPILYHSFHNAVAVLLVTMMRLGVMPV
ncbi:MAG: CPBP family intramembrane metalloprotease [Victivallales bacterium]|nr:CPBP family intramembrane metalloprotease [Victivallales bacterium]